MSGPRVRTQIAFVIVALLVMATAVGARGAEGRTTKVVRGVGTSWAPRVIRIASGTTIRWKAVSNSHTVTAYGGHWVFNRSLPQGSSIQRRFKTQGVFLFRCRIHSQLVSGQCQGMCGKVVVGAPSSPAGSVEVATGSASGVGTVLVDGTGLTLYELDTEASGQIMCTDACRSVWPPLLLPAGVTSATSGDGVTGTLGTIMRPDSGTQVTYNGRPLYRYSGDQSPGQAAGQGIQGVWFAMTPLGPSSGGGSGGGYPLP
jgi:predicted lipoprotein with Yx(FWY)xxD motif